MNSNPGGLVGRMSRGIKRVLVRTNTLAAILKAQEIRPEHILAAEIEVMDNEVPRLLEHFGFNMDCVHHKLRGLLVHGEAEYRVPDQVPEDPIRLWTIPFSVDAQSILAKAVSIANRDGSNMVETEHLLIALVDSECDSMKKVFSKKTEREG
jgi:ATP-dependent Clp protease ATP-binding subunit ClpA